MWNVSATRSACFLPPERIFIFAFMIVVSSLEMKIMNLLTDLSRFRSIIEPMHIGAI